MAGEHRDVIGLEYYKESQRTFPKALLFALLLLLSHALELDPSEFDAGGIKIAVKDVSVVHGALALIFLYYFWMSTISEFMRSFYLKRISLSPLMIRSALIMAKRPYKDDKTKRMGSRSPKQAKRWAWWYLSFYNLWTFPFGFTIIMMLFVAFVVGIIDTYSFVQYLVGRLEIIWA